MVYMGPWVPVYFCVALNFVSWSDSIIHFNQAFTIIFSNIHIMLEELEVINKKWQIFEGNNRWISSRGLKSVLLPDLFMLEQPWPDTQNKRLILNLFMIWLVIKKIMQQSLTYLHCIPLILSFVTFPGLNNEEQYFKTIDFGIHSPIKSKSSWIFLYF